MAAQPLPLSGAGILVTRAAHQADQLCELIREHGGNPIRFPALEIHGVENQGDLQRLEDRAGRFDLVVYVSPNAVRYGARILAVEQTWRPAIAAVGATTAQCLTDAGLAVDIVPRNRFDSEALLETPEFRQVAGKRVLIVRGVGGRALLGDVLTERGAEVEYLEVYRRECPVSDPRPLLERWDREIQVVTATSSEILWNLHRILGSSGRARLVGTPVLVVGERMREKASELGHDQILVSARADDRALVEALCRWSRGRTASP